MMPHQAAYELISAYVDGELSPQETAHVEQLLDSSDELRRYCDDLREVSDQVAALPQFSLGADFENRVMDAISRRSPAAGAARAERRRKAAWRIAAVIAAAAAAVALMFALRPPGQPDNVTQGGGDGDPFPTVPVAAQPNVMMVYEVSLTSTGVARKSFESALAGAGIEFDSPIPVDAKLENLLLKNRFFGPLDQNGSQAPRKNLDGQRPPTPFELVYVVGRGRQIDAIHQHLMDEKRIDAVQWLKMDMAAYPADFDFFQHVHQASDLQLAQGPQRPTQVLADRAQRMAMDVVFHTRLGKGLRTLSVPALGLLQSAITRGLPHVRRQSTGRQQQFKEMEGMTFGVLFVIRSPVSN